MSEKEKETLRRLLEAAGFFVASIIYMLVASPYFERLDIDAAYSDYVYFLFVLSPLLYTGFTFLEKTRCFRMQRLRGGSEKK
jgi:hypothetical protein